MRLWLKFSRADELAFISHLDAHKAYYRMFRRADIALALSQGFNPHPIVSLAAPLPLGFQSEADYLDLTLANPMKIAEIEHRLKHVSGHEALKLKGLREITGRVPALAGLVAWAEYEITLGQGYRLSEAIERFKSSDAAPFTKETKRGSREADAKTLVRMVEGKGNTLKAILSMSEPVVLRPEEFVLVLASLVGEEWDIELVSRRELYVRSIDLVTPLDLQLG